MNQRKEIYTPPQGPPQGAGPDPEIFQVMGEENIFKLLEDFYEELGKSEIREMFPINIPGAMHEASKKSASFFVFLMGGPPLYHQRHGAPMMRKRHMAFEIDAEARQVWLDTFNKVLEHAEERYSFPPQHLPGFKKFLAEFSAWMVNKQ